MGAAWAASWTCRLWLPGLCSLNAVVLLLRGCNQCDLGHQWCLCQACCSACSDLQ